MKKTLVIYWSGTGNTEAMAGAVLEGMKAAGADAALLTPDQVTPASLSGVSSVAMGCPAMGSEVLEEMDFEPFFTELERRLSGRPVALFGSYGWGDGQWMRDWVQSTQDANANLYQDQGLMINETPDEDGLEQCREFGRGFAKY